MMIIMISQLPVYFNHTQLKAKLKKYIWKIPEYFL